MKGNKKKILMVSQFSSSSDSYCYAQFLLKLAKDCGFEVKAFDCKYNSFRIGGKSVDSLWWPLKVLCNFWINVKLLIEVISYRPDILFLVKGENIHYYVLLLCKKIARCKLINFYTDSPFCCWNGNSSYSVMRSLPVYDRFAIWSRLLAKVLVASGSRQVFYWPFVCDSELFRPAQIDTDSKFEQNYYSSDVCFVGTWDRKRERYLSELKAREPDIDLKIWGEGWDKNLSKRSILSSCVKGGVLSPRKMVLAFSCSKIVLNFLRDQNFTSHNMRTFEVASCGAFLLTERSEEQAQDLFVENESIACFSTPEELCKKVVYFLTLENERKRIAQAALIRARQLGNARLLFEELTSF